VDRITAMRSFVAAAHAEGFSAGGRTLGIAGSLVARHVSGLERQLGLRLVDRSGRGISLTDEGRRYFEFSEQLLEKLDCEETAIRDAYEREEGTLSVLAPMWVGSLVLADAVAAFARAHSHIDVKFDVGGGADGHYDFVARGYDLEFHTKQLRDSSVRVRKVATLPFALCATPGYLDGRGAPRDLQDLARHRCLIHPNEPLWHFSKNERLRRYKVPHSAFSSNTYLALTKAVLAGVGIGLLPLRPVAEDVRAGRLQIVLPDYETPPRPLYVVYPPGLHARKTFRVFVDFVAAWGSANLDR